MKIHRRWAGPALFVAALSVSSVAEAALVDIGGGPIYDTDLNIQSNFYWSSTKYTPDPNYYAWNFNSFNSSQNAYHRGNSYYVWAMRPGDVAAVPHPTACWLFGSGLIGLFGIVRRKAA